MTISRRVFVKSGGLALLSLGLDPLFLGRAAYALRKSTVEPVFGQIRAARRFQQLSFRGLLKNRCEWAFVCLTHNLLKLFRAASPPLAAAS